MMIAPAVASLTPQRNLLKEWPTMSALCKSGFWSHGESIVLSTAGRPVMTGPSPRTRRYPRCAGTSLVFSENPMITLDRFVVSSYFTEISCRGKI